MQVLIKQLKSGITFIKECKQYNVNMAVYDSLKKKLAEDGAAFLPLIDPDEQSIADAVDMAGEFEKHGAPAILIGGSGKSNHLTIDDLIKRVKQKVKIPIITYPGNISDVSKFSDAILFMSLLNSRSNYWTTIAQASAAVAIKENNIEPISMGYLIIEGGSRSSASFYGDANEIPRNKPKIATSFALAAQYLGMKLAYLEAGSGAEMSVPENMIEKVKSAIDIPLIVGGGITNGETAYLKVKAGADFVVIGNTFQKDISKVKEIADAVKKAGSERLE